jgi:superfamily II DNA or RNA helicase
MYEFFYISAPPGANKTGWAISTLARKIIDGRKNILFVVPTTKLCDEIAKRGWQENLNIQTIHNKNIDPNEIGGVCLRIINLKKENN